MNSISRGYTVNSVCPRNCVIVGISMLIVELFHSLPQWDKWINGSEM